MLVLLQLDEPAGVPLKVMVLLPCVAPKLVPVIVKELPIGPEAGLRLVIVGWRARFVSEKLAGEATPETEAVTL